MPAATSTNSRRSHVLMDMFCSNRASRGHRCSALGHVEYYVRIPE